MHKDLRIPDATHTLYRHGFFALKSHDTLNVLKIENDKIITKLTMKAEPYA